MSTFIIVATVSRCPDGYTVGKLDASHAELVASKWPYVPNTESWFKQMILSNLSVAAFSDADRSVPVSWILQYSHGGMSNLYTLDTHRRQGLAMVVTAALCQLILDDGSDIPPCCNIVENNTASIKMFEKLGFVYSNFKTHYIKTI